MMNLLHLLPPLYVYMYLVSYILYLLSQSYIRIYVRVCWRRNNKIIEVGSQKNGQ